MKKILFILVPTLAILLAACNTTQKTNTTTEKEPTATTAKEPEMADGDKAFTLKTLNDTIASPRMELSGKIGDATLAVTFGSPKVKGRTIWGELVKYGKVWRMGANEATTLETSADIMVNGAGPLPAGKYAVFAVPAEEGNWKLVFNSEAEQWGAYNKDDAKDVLSVDAKPEMKEDVTEGLTFAIDGDKLVMMWEKLSLPITIAGS
ncbi:MAG: DUF2911 domain-containing protein [Bacteroidia bacterium]|nr:DUF2911 domain-containing protein [Bacteroidia bacterium]